MAEWPRRIFRLRPRRTRLAESFFSFEFGFFAPAAPSLRPLAGCGGLRPGGGRRPWGRQLPLPRPRDAGRRGLLRGGAESRERGLRPGRLRRSLARGGRAPARACGGVLGRSRGHLGLFLASTAAGLRPHQGRGLRHRVEVQDSSHALVDADAPVAHLLYNGVDHYSALIAPTPWSRPGRSRRRRATLAARSRKLRGPRRPLSAQRPVFARAPRGKGSTSRLRGQEFPSLAAPRPPASRPAQAAGLAARRRGPPSPLRQSPGAASGKRQRRRRSCRTM